MRFVVFLYRLLGRRLCGLVILPVVGYFFLTGRQSRRASRLYLERLHAWSGGLLPRRRRPTWWDAFLHHWAFGVSILDRVGFWLGDARPVDLVIHGREHLTRVGQNGRGAVFVSAHLGSFDALRVSADRDGAVVNVVMYIEHARMINAIFKRLRPDVDLRMITAAAHSIGWLFELRARVAKGELVGILADRVGPDQSRHVSWVPFLGVPAPFPQGPFLLATRLRCPLFLVLGIRRDHRAYDIFVEPIRDEAPAGVEQLVRAFVDRLEVFCARAPYQWFNFYDYWPDPSHPPIAEEDSETKAAAVTEPEPAR
jgi:predicted LPLAT superfamily acyltransferase